MCVGSWSGAVADDDAAPIVRLSYNAQPRQPSKVVPAERRTTGTRETIYFDDDDDGVGLSCRISFK
ncbi:BQ5605_C026g10244 [Microbotryum silenes-dioicae]|uniref:BQ5605_C026g10244 protein n=1 Tax=Microbotryum silenes-dioicae TaxID=796604 RepID=A0A2X0MR41_9BASI|nr:BQ5605_C026g10244 [Microbotryum silenes-dioicae]